MTTIEIKKYWGDGEIKEHFLKYGGISNGEHRVYWKESTMIIQAYKIAGMTHGEYTRWHGETKELLSKVFFLKGKEVSVPRLPDKPKSIRTRFHSLEIKS